VQPAKHFGRNDFRYVNLKNADKKSGVLLGLHYTNNDRRQRKAPSSNVNGGDFSASRFPIGASRRIVHSWDTAFKTGRENDFSVCTIWGVLENAYHLLWLWRERVDFPELKKRILLLAQQYRPNQILIEDHASGQCLIQELTNQTGWPIIPIKVDRDKIARAEAVTPFIECGKVFLPESAPWVRDYIDEMAAFPNGLYDDAVDSTSQALNYLRQRPRNTLQMTIVRL